ncbi:hypothetical protein BgiMline_001240, partial [Biomphalaria glabrata]
RIEVLKKPVAPIGQESNSFLCEVYKTIMPVKTVTNCDGIRFFTATHQGDVV